MSLNSLKINEVFILDYARKFSMITDIENLSLAKRKLKLFLHKKGYILKKEFPFLERLYFFDRKNTPWNVFFKGYAWFHDSKKVDKFYSQIIGNLLIFSDEKSILQYKAIFSGNPRAIFSTYVNNLFERPQYCEFLNFKNYNVINIGVHLGYEIPIFLKMIGNKGHLVNVDPGGNKYIDKRIKPLVGDNHISFIYEFVGDGSLVRYEKRKDNQFVVKNNKPIIFN